MSESLTSRVGRLISGGFNAIVDAVENMAPEVVMEQAIREVDGVIDEIRVELGREIAQKHLASKRILEENAKHETLAEQLQLAVGQGRDDLAEAAIARQLDIEAQIPILEQSIAERSAREKELEGYVKALLAKKREMQEELTTLRNFKQEQQRAGQETEAKNGVPSARASKADAAFERMLKMQTGVPRRNESVEESAKLAELEDMARKNRIQERLAAAKANL